MNTKNITIALVAVLASASLANAQDFKLNQSGYFNCEGVDVMAFDDIYPEGHQGGVSILMNGRRIATSGDLRLEATPGQWQPLPKQLRRELGQNTITAYMQYPDSARHLTGFNPMIYPDLQLTYTVELKSVGQGFEVTVNLDQPIPEYMAGKIGFNMEFFPGYAFGQPWIMDQQTGVFPRQANAPLEMHQPNHLHMGDYHDSSKSKANVQQLLGKGYSPIVADDIIGAPYAQGKCFTCYPNDPLSRVTIQSHTSDLKLYDGRVNHNNGWFVLRSEVPVGATSEAIKWTITPNVVKGWMSQPVVQTSQVGYCLNQQKVAVIELDANDKTRHQAQLIRIDAEGEKTASEVTITEWGHFLRYNYLTADFTEVTEPGLYRLQYGQSSSPIFRIADDVYDRGVWQPVLEYFLPVQMCHMRVSEKYRIWHDACHMDDALMAQAHNHIDGYDQRPNTFGRYKAGEKVPGVNIGGWHDAGDYDLRIESQIGEAYILALAQEAFNIDLDVTTIDHQRHITEIHQPDGRNDNLQQIENGALTVVNSYLALGRLYRGIICNSLRQYVLLGDAASMTDGIVGNEDDRWIYTENNPQRELSAAAQLAGVSRVLSGFNDTLSVHCLNIARSVYDATPVSAAQTNGRRALGPLAKTQAAVELYLTTGEEQYLNYLLDNQKAIIDAIGATAWYTARAEQKMTALKKNRRAQAFSKAFRAALVQYNAQIERQAAETPYGVPYRPAIWGAGWDIQNFGFRHYFLASTYPELVSSAPVLNALNFVLGCHPGSNQASFASGVGSQSATTAYGANRADWSYIPGGVVSGTALIRPDFPELLEFPFLWQQTEYCLGGASSHYMFIALAAQKMCSAQ